MQLYDIFPSDVQFKFFFLHFGVLTNHYRINENSNEFERTKSQNGLKTNTTVPIENREKRSLVNNININTSYKIWKEETARRDEKFKCSIMVCFSSPSS